MRLPRAKTSLYVVAFVIFLLLFAYFLLNYTRRVDGVSMWPTLESGDLVVIQPVSMNDVHIGDIIVYGPPCSVLGFSVIHRVVGGNEKTGFITQGDDRITNPNTDQTNGDIAKSNITQACLIGKVVFVVPYIERLASLPYGLNYIIVLIIFLVIIATEVAGRQVPQPAETEEKIVGPARAIPVPADLRNRGGHFVQQAVGSVTSASVCPKSSRCLLPSGRVRSTNGLV